MLSLSSEAKGSLYAIGSGLCYGLVGYFGITLVNSGLSVATMTFWRFAVASFICLLMLIPQYKHFTSKNFNSIIKIFFLSGVFYGCSTMLYFKSSQYIGTGLGMVIFFIYPTFVIALERVLYKHKISKLYYLAITIITIGLILLVDLQGMTFDLIGISLSILNALFFSVYVFSCKRTKLSPLASTLVISGGCAFISFVIAYIDGNFTAPSRVNDWIYLLPLSLICTMAPTFLLVKSLQYISSEKASILTVLEPIFVLLSGVVLLGEYVSYIQLLGAMTILIGAMMTLVKKESIMLKLNRLKYSTKGHS